MKTSLITLTFFLFSFVSLKATNPPSFLLKDETKPHSPKSAAMYSSVLPGLGQAYNKKYWKIPIIYAGLGGLGYIVKINNDSYQDFKTAYIHRVDGDPSTIDQYVNTYSDGNLNTLQEYYHRNRDLAIIGCAAFYILNIVDATVDAHLYEFDVSDQLSLTLNPEINRQMQMGLCLKLNIK